MELERFRYDNTIVRAFTIATVVWGLVGMLVGVIIACQLFIPSLNVGLPYLTFGRIRPLHTNAVIFAFVGNAIFMGVYYSLPRLCKAPMFSRLARQDPFLGMAGDHRCRRRDPSPRTYDQQGIRRAGMADRHRDHAGLGGLRRQHVRHDHQAARTPHVRGDLVLHRHGRHGRRPAYRELLRGPASPS